MVYSEDAFDLSLVFFLRKMIANQIEKDPNFSINGLPIEFAIEGTLENYVRNVVMKMDEDAQEFMFCIAPFVLRVNITTVFVDAKNKMNNFSL